ncbi:MAG: uncharacterized protein QG670_1661 [Thermoproteota archaeon]|nr:uncharacterized protein [Thermoproteota archaeon]
MTTESKKTIFLIPGASPKAARIFFDAINTSLKPEFEIIELERADERDLLSRVKNVKLKILVGKSAGGRIAVNYQFENKDAQALVLLAPGTRSDNRLSQIQVPILIVHGTKDNVIPLENSRKIAKLFKNCKLVEIPGIGHSFEGKESEIAEIIKEWIISLH